MNKGEFQQIMLHNILDQFTIPFKKKVHIS